MSTLTPKQIKTDDARIRKEIDTIYIDPTGNSLPIYDGVIDPELYCSSSPRIMWVLKEPWDEDNSSGGGWSLCSDLLAKVPVSSLSQSTFHPIIYIAYGIFNGIDLWDDLPWVRDMKSPESVLRSIAFINAKKLPGVTHGAYHPAILQWYGKARNVIKDQISSYLPDIIFGCVPHFPLLLTELSPGWLERAQTAGSATYTWVDQKLFVFVHHPGQKQCSRQQYVEDALAAVKTAIKLQKG